MSEVKHVFSHSCTRVYPTTNAQQLNPTIMCHGARSIFNLMRKYHKTVNTGVAVNMTVLEKVRKEIAYSIPNHSRITIHAAMISIINILIKGYIGGVVRGRV